MPASVTEVSRGHGQTLPTIESWVGVVKVGMENAGQADPLEILELSETQR
jgi:hypothetical protein